MNRDYQLFLESLTKGMAGSGPGGVDRKKGGSYKMPWEEIDDDIDSGKGVQFEKDPVDGLEDYVKKDNIGSTFGGHQYSIQKDKSPITSVQEEPISSNDHVYELIDKLKQAKQKVRDLEQQLHRATRLSR